MNSLDQLAQYTTIVADTGDLATIARLRPKEATTNPSLITTALMNGEHDQLLSKVRHLDIDSAIDELTLRLGQQIASLIEGRVSVEMDASLSFDSELTVKKAVEFVENFDKMGVSCERLLIKIASTWEGITAAKILEKQGIACNLTLLFTKVQAQACADAGVTLISPFVGRISDWQKRQYHQDNLSIDKDMGVNSVKEIYHFYKNHGYTTQVMGASFRSVEQILALAGCDLLTISPAFLDTLAKMGTPVSCQLSPSLKVQDKPPAIGADEFASLQNNHPLNTLLLAGIEGFVQARKTLGQFLAQR